MDTRICSKCKIERPASDYAPYTFTQCLHCYRAKRKAKADAKDPSRIERRKDRELIKEGRRRCTICKEIKDLSVFNLRKANCDPCARVYLNNHKQSREGRAKRERERRKEQRDTVLKYYGNACNCCGETERAFLAIDHVNGGGNEHRKSVRAHELPRFIIKNNFPPEYQILCHNCNMARHHLGVCPHQTKHS